MSAAHHSDESRDVERKGRVSSRDLSIENEDEEKRMAAGDR